MIEKEKILSLEFYNYKGIFTGSQKGMRYRIEKITIDDNPFFSVDIWPEPYNYDVTPKSDMLHKDFPFSEEGKLLVVEWLNQTYDANFSSNDDPS